MTTGFRNTSGVDFDSLFDPYVQGTAPSATGLRLSSGVDLAGRFAPITFGSKGPDVGFRTSAGGDVSNLWAASGTAKYNLPIDGTSYTSTQSGVNGSAQLVFNMNSDGTYSIVRGVRGVTTTMASGTWLPTGDSVANYSCYFSASQSGVTQTGDCGFNNTTNAPASTAVALTTSRQYTADADTFTTPGAVARQTIAVTCNYYRLGVLVHAVHVTFTTNATS